MPIEEIIDDVSIPPSAALWRRIFEEDIYPDPKLCRKRANSGSLFDGDAPMSVDLAMLTTLDEVNKRGEGMAIAEFTVDAVRQADCKIVRDPLPENPAHALIYGNHANGGPTQGQAGKIAKQSKVVFDLFSSE